MSLRALFRRKLHELGKLDLHGLIIYGVSDIGVDNYIGDRII